MLKFFSLLSLTLSMACQTQSVAQNWTQGAGPNHNFIIPDSAPVKWSVVNNENILWKITKPETGQGIPVIHNDKVFFSTMKELPGDAELGKDTVAWCCDANTGKILWQSVIEGGHLTPLSGCFTDASAPPALVTKESVIFINSTGTITCFDLNGKVIWSKKQLSVGRTLPFLHNGNYIYTRQTYWPDEKGHYPQKRKDTSSKVWTQLEALDVKTGEPVWSSTCGVNMGNAITLQKLNNGKEVIVCGRGGGHGPPEKPEGISLIDANDGKTLWTLPLEKFMATQTFFIRNDQVHLFHNNEHLSVDAKTGKILKRTDFLSNVPVRKMIDGKRQTVTESIKKKSSRMLTQGSNLLVGKYHYFRSYTMPYLGRVDVDSGKVEYLELPLQLKRESGKEDQFKWFDQKAKETTGKKKAIPINYQYFVPNDLKNSRGFTVFGDKRSKGNGWGHVATATATVAGDHLYIPMMSGTVFVIKWNSETLDENSIAAINDLGPIGKSFNRATLTFANGRIYAHTIREFICIGEK
ncbi:MAG: PQQ-like beta-propeller repeat protein [Lentisphaeraceae bacterium]|nr:PQQ-like beta-propeller repeat protein [Lentisphaeraceae bacterium]